VLGVFSHIRIKGLFGIPYKSDQLRRSIFCFYFFFFYLPAGSNSGGLPDGRNIPLLPGQSKIRFRGVVDNLIFFFTQDFFGKTHIFFLNHGALLSIKDYFKTIMLSLFRRTTSILLSDENMKRQIYLYLLPRS
jgi:hypothetical protein